MKRTKKNIEKKVKLGNDPNIIRRLLKYGRTLFKDYK